MQGKRFYNVDESWVDKMNFTLGHWKPRLYAMETAKAVSPRISLISCVGTDGSASYCLTQVNTNNKVFSLYLTWLVKRLTQEDPNWKENSILLLE